MAIFASAIVAAYSRLASRSQAKFKQWNWVPFPLREQPHLRRAPYPLRLLFTSIYASLVCGCQSSQANSSIEKKIVCGCRNACQSLSGVDVFLSRLWWRSRVYFVSVSSRACIDKMAESKSREWSSSTASQLKFPDCTHYHRRNDNHYRCQQCRLNEWLTLCIEIRPARSVRIGCRRPGRRKRKPTNRSTDARRWKQQRSPKSVRRWTTQVRYMLRKRCFNFLPSVPAKGRPSPNEPR